MAEFPYLANAAKIGEFFTQIQGLGKPSKVNTKWLEGIGFKSTNDRPILNLLKFLKFTDDSGTPTERWAIYRNREQAPIVMAQALRESYSILFETYPDAHSRDDDSLRNFFSTHSSLGAKSIEFIVRTFKSLAGLANFDTQSTVAFATPNPTPTIPTTVTPLAHPSNPITANSILPITMNIQIVIPSDATAEQYDKIFSSIKKFLTYQEKNG